MKKKSNIIGKIILIILIFILLFISYCKYIRKDKVIKIGKYAILIVLTESMEPVLSKEELILIKQYDEYKVQDIVTYEDMEGLLISHRIVKINEKYFTAKGDNNVVIDNNIPIKNIYGKVIFSSKILGKFILHYLKILIIIYAIVIIILFVIKKNMEAKKVEYENET